ncbi:protein disulfide-isomerase [Colletotrichum sojae]|uniref:Protein disulfide-isomerase n=1 Tax=Colletotrichum sojae TaxID=2175907 RepID=A0A8H6IP29_9PEZI|nr:protein disulfide-isomerase [Colletotrichum sojae]
MLLQQCTKPLVPEITRRNEMGLLNVGLLIHDPEYLIFVIIDANEYSDLASSMGLPREAPEALALQNPKIGKGFPFNGIINPEITEKFILDISDGKIQSWDEQALKAINLDQIETHDER